jgi:hypothetical protein
MHALLGLMSEVPSTEMLSKSVLAELRSAHGDLSGTQRALMGFFQRGLASGLSLERCMRLLFFEPCQAGSLFRRVGYADHEYDRMVQIVRELPLHEVLLRVDAEPGAPPNGGLAERLGDSGVSGGPPSVS